MPTKIIRTRPVHMDDILEAIDWCLESREAKGTMPDVEKNPNSKLSIIWRAKQEIIRLRAEVVKCRNVIDYLEKESDKQCPP